jgi:hypothetical protein
MKSGKEVISIPKLSMEMRVPLPVTVRIPRPSTMMEKLKLNLKKVVQKRAKMAVSRERLI